ncbi:MAG TPA: serine hydrolase domain-containing protein [Blastocatellia bacterium]|nr:serine hydrolase domain-containing protein [Blastocatellia bacterium]
MKNIALVLVFTLGPVLHAWSQNDNSPRFPDTPAAKRVEAFLKAFNSGDPKAMRDFHANNAASGVLSSMSLDDISQQDQQMYNDFGGLELRRVVESGQSSITVLLQAKKGQWLNFRCEVEPAPPHKIVGLGIEPASAPADAKPANEPKPPAASANRAKRSDAEIVAALEKFLDEQVKADEFSGTVLLAKDGKTIFEKAYGLASKSFNVPNNIDTKFNLGSMNKMFTAVAIAQLAEQGKLSFNDTVGKHLPNYPNKAVADKVTIHHLLTHTSGMGSYFNQKYIEAAKDRFKKVEDYAPLYVDEPLAFEPGQKWAYSNSGFMLLGAIIEKVSGQNYFDYVREHIYKPAGMTNTDCYEMDTDTPNLAIGYTRGGPDGRRSADGSRKNNLFLHVVKGGPAGGGFSTVRDLLRFDIALRNHKLLSAKYTETVLTGKVDVPRRDGAQAPAGVQVKYAYGFMDRVMNGARTVGHGGGFPGINGQLDMYLDLGYTVAVLSNYDPPAAGKVADKARQLITQQE